MIFLIKLNVNTHPLKNKYTIFYFTLAILDILAENYSITYLVVLSRLLLVLVAFYGYSDKREYNFHKIDKLLALSLFFATIGLLTSYLIPVNRYYITINSVVSFIEIQLQIFIIRSFFYSKTDKLSDEITKTVIVLSVGMAFIYLLFPMMDFWDQIVIFSRVLQFSFFFAYVFRNKNLHLQVELSFWTILISNILSVVVLYIQVHEFSNLFANFLFFVSKLLFIIGLLYSIKRKKNFSNSETD